MSKGFQTTSPGIAGDHLHHHTEQSKISMHLPQKEDLGSMSSDGDRTAQTTPITSPGGGGGGGGGGGVQNGVGRRRREDGDDHSGMDIGQNQSATIRSLAKDVERLREQLRSTKKELEEANQRYRDSETNLEALKRANSNLAEEVQKCNEREAIYLQTAQRLAKDTEQKTEAQETENIILRQRLRAADDTIQRMTSVLQERTADLKGVQTFLNTADLYSGAEVVSMVESLNTDFFQISAFVADLVEDEEMAASEEEWSENRRNLVTALSNDARYFAGDKLYAHICHMTMDLRMDALPLQLVIQALLSGWCLHHVRIHCWGPMHHKIDEIYKNIQSTETQAVSGRWRAITTANLTENYSQTKRLFDAICNLLNLCGWSSSSPQAQKATTTFNEMLTSMQKQIIQLRKAVREGITTADLEIFGHTPGTPFQEKVMEDIYKTSDDSSVDPAAKSNKRILCTVGLGLRKSVARNRAESSSGQVDVLLKPQVALESILSHCDVAAM